MEIHLSPRGVLSAFDKLGPRSQEIFLSLLNQSGVLHAVKERAVVDARINQSRQNAEILEHKNRVLQLEADILALKRQAKDRLTRAERIQRLRDLKEQGLNASEIAARMASEGEPMKPGAVRTALHRMNKPG
jgi:hypothetical protein